MYSKVKTVCSLNTLCLFRRSNIRIRNAKVGVDGLQSRTANAGTHIHHTPPAIHHLIALRGNNWRWVEHTSNNSWHAHKAIFHDILLSPFFLCRIIQLDYIQRLLCRTNTTHCHQFAASCHDAGTGSLCWHVSQPVPAISAQAVGFETVKRYSRRVTSTNHVQMSVTDDRRRIDSLCGHRLHWLPHWLDAASCCHLSPLQSPASSHLLSQNVFLIKTI